MAWLLDTNVLSELRRARPNPNVLAFFARHPIGDFFVSVVSIAEIRFGIEASPDAAKRIILSGWLDQQVRPMFGGRVLAIDEEILLRWRQLVEDGRKAGHTFSQPDLLIASTALTHGLTIATRDQGDFSKTGAKLLDPWKPV